MACWLGAFVGWAAVCCLGPSWVTFVGMHVALLIKNRSRCAKFRFLPLSDESIHSRLRFIASAEGVPITDGICNALTETSGGDMRKAITCVCLFV